MGFFQLFGRVLIVLALASSAYHHLQHPSHALKEVTANYAVVDSLSKEFFQFDLPWDNANWLLFVRIFGLFEALVVLLIVLGENLGGVFYVLSLILEVFFLLWPKIAAQKLNVWNFSELSELSHFAVLIGVGLVLAAH